MPSSKPANPPPTQAIDTPGLEDTVAAPADPAPRAARPEATLTDWHGSEGGVAKDDLADELHVIERECYHVEREIARGGMGRILRARDRRHGRVVALKESLRSEPTLIARFTREAMITARLQHPAIVPVYEAGKWHSGDPFYAMKMVEGTSLSKEIERRPTLAQRMELLPNLLAVTEALAYAHTHGVIHRDLKPSNVLIGSFGETVVIDWGLAKTLDMDTGLDSDTQAEPPEGQVDPGSAAATPADAPTGSGTGPADSATAPELTAAGHVIGTPAYMAPEQADAASVDQRADVYALGAIAYHLLAGKAPYEGKSSADVLERVLAGPPVAVRKLEVDVPADLAAIVDKAMARDPAARYPSAKELAADLRRFHTGQLVSTHAYSLLDLTRRFVTRHRAAVVVAASMLVAMIALGGLAVDEIINERNTARAERARAELLSREATQQRERADELNMAMLAMLDQRSDTTGQNVMREDVASELGTYYETRAKASAHTHQDIERGLRTMHILAKTSHMQGDVERALRLYRRSEEIAEKLGDKRPPTPELTRIMAENHERIASILISNGDTAGARDEFEQAIAQFHSLTGNNSLDPDLHAHLSHLYAQLGLALLLEDESDSSMRAYESSREHARALIAGPDLLARDQVAGVVFGGTDAASATPFLDERAGEHGDEHETTVIHVVASTSSDNSDSDDVPGEHEAGSTASLVRTGANARAMAMRRPDPRQLIKLSNAPAEYGLMVALDNLDQQLEALGDSEKSLAVYRRVERALDRSEAGFGNMGSQLTRAELYLKLAHKLADKDATRAANYAGQCVDILEQQAGQDGLSSDHEADLRTARDMLQRLHDHALPAHGSGSAE